MSSSPSEPLAAASVTPTTEATIVGGPIGHAPSTAAVPGTVAKKTSGPGGHKPPAYVTFTNKLKPEYWPGWDPAMITSGDLHAIGDEFIRRYEAAGGDLTGLWLNRHDRDLLPDLSIKDDHIHGVAAQAAARSTSGRLQCADIDRAMGWLGSICRAPARGGRIENAQAYLIHAKDPDKFQYPVSDVVTIRGLEYAEVEKENRRAWARRAVIGRQAVIPAKEWNDLGDMLIQKVLENEIDELDLLQNKTFMDIYTRNEPKLRLALSLRARRDMVQEVEKLRAGEFQKTVIWVTGASDQGKSWAVESVAQELAARLHWRIFRATARNGPDDYLGEEVFLMSEPSTRVMEWADLLVLTDPRQAGPISARYRNKADAAPRVILIAVSVDPVEFGFFVPGKRSTSDSVDQLVRRLSMLAYAQKVGDEPRYSVGPVGLLTHAERRSIQVPKEGYETIYVDYGLDPAASAVDLTHDELVGVVLSEVARRSPDARLALEPGRTLPALLAAGATTVADQRAAAVAAAASLASVTRIESANDQGVFCELPTDVYELLRDQGVVA